MSEKGDARHHFDFADFRLYPHERLLMKGPSRIPLTPRVLDLLIVLIERKGELVSKELLLDAIWADSYVDESNISRAISTLRKNLGVQKNGGDFIETVPKLGYRFIAPVQPGLPASGGPVLNGAMTARRSRFWPFAVLFVLVCTVGGYLFFTRHPSFRPSDRYGITNVTNSVAEDNLPNWSPDGTKIAFTSNRDGTGDIFSMDSDGSNVTRLTYTAAAEHASVWSPDGTKIAFDSERDGNREIYIMNSDGSNQVRLTYNPTTDAGPVSFSPDGQRIAFSRNASTEGRSTYDFNIFVMNVDGGDVRQLTNDPEYDAEPVWSPDGARILFVSGRDANFEVYSIDIDGTNEVNITKSPTKEGPIAFTADGKDIFLSGDTVAKPEFTQVWLVNLDGANRRQVTSFTDKVYRLALHLNTRKFAYSTKIDGNFEIYTIDAGIPGPH
jgi:Tol biopolymer transport system component/DNA-binding winged helix-turn-helix (wHTH) protein